MRIHDQETPGTRLREYGVHALSDHELVALLVGNPHHRWLEHGLVRLAHHTGTPGRLQAAFELGRRLHALTPALSDTIDTPDDLARPLLAKYGHAPQERLGVVYLDTRRRLLQEREVYVGTLNNATVASRDVFKYALELNAAEVVLFHNHPSGDPRPSTDDLTYTRKVVQAGALLQVAVLDHLVLAAHRYYSFRAHGAL